ncbi:MAG TPA: winged helix-turn-helix domain-containing protein [Terriglobales bacterium]
MYVPVQSPRRISFREFELDLASGELFKDGQKVPLPPKAFEVLRALVEHPGEVVTREDLPPACGLQTPSLSLKTA